MKNNSLNIKRIGYWLFAAIGILFVFCYESCLLLAKQGNIRWTVGKTLVIALSSVILGVLLGWITGKLVFRWQNKRTTNKKEALGNIQEEVKPWSLLLMMALLFIAWLPYFLAYYPGICAYDAVTQIGQIETGEYGTHHPLAHTLFIRGCLAIGQTIGNPNGGVAVYSLIQMLFLAFAVSYGIFVLAKYRVSRKTRLALLLLGMLYPFNGYLSVSMTKDIFFSAFFLLQILLLMELIWENHNTLKPGLRDVFFVLCSIGMILFRNNGRYALLVLICFLVLCQLFAGKSKRFFGRILIECVGGVVIGNIILSGLALAVNGVPGDKREMLSLPIQQLARCMLYHGGDGILPEDDNTMKAQDKELIREFFRENGYERYSPHISDPVKAMTQTSVVRYQPVRFAKTYLRLLAAYPGDFINAALEVNAGYLYPEDISHSTIYQEMYPGMKGKGYVQTQWWESVVEKTGITMDSKWPSLKEKMERFADRNSYLKIPILKYLFVPGVWLWLYLIGAVSLFVQKKFRLCLSYGLILGYFITLLLGPVVQLRYIFPMMISLPFMVLLGESDGRKNEVG